MPSKVFDDIFNASYADLSLKKLLDDAFNALYADLLRNKLVHVEEDRYATDASSEWPLMPAESINIVDVPLQVNQAAPPQVNQAAPPQVNQAAKLVYRDDKMMTSEELQKLPSQQTNTCRMYIAHGYETNKDFTSHVEGLVSQQFADFDKSTALTTPNLLTPIRSELSGWSWNFSLLKSRHSSFGIFPGTCKCKLKIRTVWHSDGRMLCFIFCCTGFRKSYGGRELSEDPESVHRILTALSDDILHANIAFDVLSYPSDKTTQHRMIMLQICHALLSNHEQFVTDVRRAQQAFNQRISNPSRTIVTPQVLHISLCDFHNWRYISGLCEVFATSFQSFLDAMQLRDDVTDQRGYQTLIIELRARCVLLENAARHVTTSMDDTLRYIELGRSHRESLHVQMLSMLAIVYLPLSLASSVLSMQTRFMDLGWLLFDFFGAAILFTTLTVIVYQCLKATRSFIHKLRLRVAIRKSVIPLLILVYGYTSSWVCLLVVMTYSMYGTTRAP